MNRILLLLILSLCLGPVGVRAMPSPGILVDSYAAIVNGRLITVGDVLAALQPAQERLAALSSGAEFAQRLREEYEAVRDILIESELILLDFEKQGGTLPDRALEDHIQSVIHERFNNDRTALLRALAAERMTFSQWRRQLKDQFIVQIMRQREVTSKIRIAPFDIQQAYEENLARYTLPERVHLRTLVFPGGADAAARWKALGQAVDLRQKLMTGETDFDAAGGTASAPEWFEAGSLNDTLRAALTDIAPGGIALPVELGGAVYLIQLLDREEARTRPLEEVAGEIERELRRATAERLTRAWVDSLREKYHVQLFSHRLFD